MTSGFRFIFGRSRLYCLKDHTNLCKDTTYTVKSIKIYYNMCKRKKNKYLCFSLQNHKKASFGLGRTRIGSTGCELLVSVNQVHRILFCAYLYGRLLFITTLVSLYIIISVFILLCIIGRFIMQDLLKRAIERKQAITTTMELLSTLSKFTLNIYTFISKIKGVIVMN